MPLYELTVLIRALPKHELVPCVKRVAEGIYNKKGMIRSIDYLGTKATPYKMSKHEHVHREAAYFVIKFDGDTRSIIHLNEELSRDIDVIKRRFTNSDKYPAEMECTLHEELQPPAYRKNVQKLMRIGKNQDISNPYTKHFKYNSGLDYYPFQK